MLGQLDVINVGHIHWWLRVLAITPTPSEAIKATINLMLPALIDVLSVASKCVLSGCLLVSLLVFRGQLTASLGRMGAVASVVPAVPLELLTSPIIHSLACVRRSCLGIS